MEEKATLTEADAFYRMFLLILVPEKFQEKLTGMTEMSLLHVLSICVITCLHMTIHPDNASSYLMISFSTFLLNTNTEKKIKEKRNSGIFTPVATCFEDSNFSNESMFEWECCRWQLKCVCHWHDGKDPSRVFNHKQPRFTNTKPTRLLLNEKHFYHHKIPPMYIH